MLGLQVYVTTHQQLGSVNQVLVHVCMFEPESSGSIVYDRVTITLKLSGLNSHSLLLVAVGWLLGFDLGG